MKMPEKLLAKSYDKTLKHPPDYALLTQHSRDVAAACKAFAESSCIIALENAEIVKHLSTFTQLLLLNGWLQDLGKANSHFQEMVSGTDIMQLLRHETVSGLLVTQNEQLKEWLSFLGEDVTIAIWGAIGHHRKFDASTKPQQVPKLQVYLSHSDFSTILQEMATDLSLPPAPKFTNDLTIGHEDGGCDLEANIALYDLIDTFQEFEESIIEDPEKQRLAALIKAYGICADVAASAIARRGESAENYSLSKFVAEELNIGFQANELQELVYQWGVHASLPTETLEQIALWKEGKGSLEAFARDFQIQVAASPSYLTLAKAGCGSGKSLAAYLWAWQWCQRLQRSNMRLFFCLPTTGTATEHFKDYALESGIPNSLSHSRSRVDLQTMATTADREEATEGVDLAKAAAEALQAEEDKIEALALWSSPLVVATVDTVLGLMANARKSIYSFPAIMQSAIVFDEIHAFDDRLFGHLLVFLKNFPKLPVLLMTASLPEARLRSIQQVRSDLHCVPGLKAFEELPRYLLKHAKEFEESTLWAEVESCLANNGKVLWVRNRVEWANQTYYLAKEKFPNIYTNVYHSRLRYKDRSDRHRQVIDSFKAKERPCLLVATQVAEMSLDLSADLLITDIAPVPALIQRMGRLNRRANPEQPGTPKPAIVCALPNEKGNSMLPYAAEEYAIAEKWLDLLTQRKAPLSQQNLAEQFMAVCDEKEYDIEKAEKCAIFFSGLWRTRPSNTRTDGYTIAVVLEKDYKHCNDFRYDEPSPDWLRKHEVSIPLRKEALKWQKVGGVRIAPEGSITYDYNEDTKEGTGASWT